MIIKLEQDEFRNICYYSAQILSSSLLSQTPNIKRYKYFACVLYYCEILVSLNLYETDVRNGGRYVMRSFDS